MQGDKEFNVEVSTLSRLQHPSIVSLLGICVEGDQRIAVFELMQVNVALCQRLLEAVGEMLTLIL